jgi:uncharacterized membrane protein YhaH (DUF805 family)
MEALQTFLMLIVFGGVAVLGWCIWQVLRANNKNTTEKTKKTSFIGLDESVVRFFQGYFDYKGTATRAEYWWVITMIGIISITDRLIVMTFGQGGIAATIFLIIYAILAIPSVMLTIRRLHDIGKSGWYQLIPLAAGLLMFTGWFYLMTISIVVSYCFLVFWLASPSKYNDNKYRLCGKK